MDPGTKNSMFSRQIPKISIFQQKMSEWPFLSNLLQNFRLFRQTFLLENYSISLQNSPLLNIHVLPLHDKIIIIFHNPHDTPTTPQPRGRDTRQTPRIDAYARQQSITAPNTELMAIKNAKM